MSILSRLFNKKNGSIVITPYKPGDPIPDYPRKSYGWFRHQNPELFHLSDEEIQDLLTENSNRIQDGHIKSEAWDVLLERLKNEKGTVEIKQVLMEMENIYTEVAEDRN